ncbi:MAG: HEAT repeat domain-containing protein [Candidatus Cloacimonetes bacterium]|nr:HEAT repeat domain-containing protein [Candidatus Cloacimonadota bacterium]
MNIEALQINLVHQDAHVRSQTLTSLLKLGNHEAYGLLMFAAHNHFSSETRHEAKAAALELQSKLFGNLQNPPPMDAEELQAVEELGSEDKEVREKATQQMLQSANEPEDLQKLLEQLQREKDPQIISQLIPICAELGGNHVFAVIAPFLRSGNEKIRHSVVASFSHFDRPETTSLLIRFSRDSSAMVQQESLRKLQALSDDIVVESIRKLTQADSQALDKEAAIYVIVKLSLTKAFPCLKSLLHDKDSMVTKHVRQAIAYLEKTGKISAPPKPEPVPPIPQEAPEPEDIKEKQVQQVEPEVLESNPPQAVTAEDIADQKELLKRIGQAEEKEAINGLFRLMEKNWFHLLPELKDVIVERGTRKLLASYLMAIGAGKQDVLEEFVVECLPHPDGRIQANSIEALRLIGSSAHLEKIVPFVKSRVDRARANAIRTLHPHQMVNTSSELKEMLESGKENRQLSAIYVISDLLEPELIPLLETAMDFPNPKVTKRAIETLKMYVLKGYEPARTIAENWGILKELEPPPPEPEIESKQETDILEQAGISDSPTAPPASKSETDSLAKKEVSGSKFANLVKNLFKPKAKN